MNTSGFYELKPRFPLGRLVITPGALEALTTNRQSLTQLLVRHGSGDWGDVSDDDRQQNDLSISTGLRLISIYTMPDQTKLWVITESDRSATTFLLPNEY
ncbi:MAG: hypothetical protein WDN30_08215 [Pararobbsia sp.]